MTTVVRTNERPVGVLPAVVPLCRSSNFALGITDFS
jgi:hypothetical protein